MHSRTRVPLCVVSGLNGPDKRSFILALLAKRPADACWALLDNDGGDIAQATADLQLAVSVISGCACCTGQVALQTGIARLIRQARPQRLILAASGAAEPAALEHALRQEPLARGLHIDHRLCVAPAPPWSGLPAQARGLLQRQIGAADHVVCAGAAALPTEAGAARKPLQFGAAIRLVLASPAPASSASSSRIAS